MRPEWALEQRRECSYASGGATHTKEPCVLPATASALPFYSSGADRKGRKGLKQEKGAPERAFLFKADGGTRTPDPFITSEVLYQLSYVGRRRAKGAPCRW